MRRIACLTLVLAVALVSSLPAAPPRTISYQGVLKDEAGLVPDGSYEMAFRIYASPSGGTSLWEETQTLDLASGVFHAILGSVTAIDLDFDIPYWLGVAVGEEPEMTSRVPFCSSPYAFRSAVADSAVGVVTEVVAGDGLEGGGGAGPVTVGIADQGVTGGKLADGSVTGMKIADATIEFRSLGNNNASPGQVMKWNGSAWVSSDDFGVAGPIANIVAEEGLIGGGDHGDVHLGVAPEGIQEHMLGAGSVTSSKIAADAVGSTALAAAAVTNEKLSANAVASANLIDDAITSSKIGAGEVQSDDLGSGAVGSAAIEDSAVDTADLADGSVTSAKIADLTVDTVDLAGGAVTTAKIAASAVDSTKLSADAVTAEKIAEEAVGTSELGADAVTSEKIAAGTVLTSDLADSCVTTAKLASAAVDSTKLASGAVTRGRLAVDAVTSEKVADGSILFADVGQNGAATGQVLKWDGAAWVAANDNTGAGGGGGWVDDGSVLRLETGADSVGIGTEAPQAKLDVDGGIHAAGSIRSGNSLVIDGPNERITAAGGTIDFEDDNLVTIGKATIGDNENTGVASFVVGEGNSVNADYSSIGGGRNNRVDGQYSVVGGGYGNRADEFATVAGGGRNFARGRFSFIGGGGSLEPWPSGANRADGEYAVIGGGNNNWVTGRFSVIGGGGGLHDQPDSANVAEGAHCVIAGGSGNRVGFAGGGSPDDLHAFAVVSGGLRNEANMRGASVGGGAGNLAGALDPDASNWGEFATVGGGGGNRATGRYSVIAGGGQWNGGPDGNRAAGDYSVVGGGAGCQAGYELGGGPAEGHYATVAGGWRNVASGDFSAIPGGEENRAAGEGSFAAGRYAKALDNGSIVLAATVTTDPADSLSSGREGQMVLRADEGFYLTESGGPAPTTSRFLDTSTGAYLSSSGQWMDVSDRNAKEDFTEVDRRVLLDRVGALPIFDFRFKADDQGARHLGPVAQDFHRIFELGENDRTVSALDVAGVSLAAIQRLHELNREQQEEITQLRGQLEELRTIVEESRRSRD